MDTTCGHPLWAPAGARTFRLGTGTFRKDLNSADFRDCWEDVRWGTWSMARGDWRDDENEVIVADVGTDQSLGTLRPPKIDVQIVDVPKVFSCLFDMAKPHRQMEPVKNMCHGPPFILN
jgi:hypothetical protein